MSVPAPSRASSTASAGLDHHEQRHALLAGQRRQPPRAPGRDLQRHRVTRGGWAPAGGAGRPAAPAPPASRPAPAATTPPAAPARCPGRPDRPAAPAARSRNRRTAPAAAPSPAPGPRRRAAYAHRQVPRQDPGRPAIGGDVMHHQHQHMLARGPAASSRARTGTSAARSNGSAAIPATTRGQVLLGHRGHRQLPAQPPPGPGSAGTAARPSAGNTVRSTSCRPITSPSAASSAAASSSPSSRSASGHVVQRRRALQLGDEPQPLLRERQRHPLRPRPAPPAPPGPGPPAPAAPPAAAGVGASNTARTASSAPSTARTRLTSRTASSECPPRAKKSSSGPDPLHAQHVGEHPAQASPRATVAGSRPAAAPRRSPGRAAPPGPASRSGSAAARPAPRAPRAPGTPAAAPRHAPAPPPPARPASAVAGGDQVAGQPPVARGVLPDDHRRLGHPRAGGQHRLDLARLDPEPADLHLIIGPPGEHQLPARRSTGPGPRSGTSAPPARRTGTPRTAPRSAPAAADSRGPAAPRRCTAPRPPPPGPGQPPVQHKHPGIRPAATPIGG